MLVHSKSLRVFHSVFCLLKHHSLVTVLEDYESVKNVTRRLREFVDSEKVVCSGSTALTDVVRVKDTTCRFIHALSEMVSHLETFEGTITGQQVSHEIVAEAQSLMALSKSHRDSLIVVVDAMNSTGTPILLQGIIYTFDGSVICILTILNSRIFDCKGQCGSSLAVNQRSRVVGEQSFPPSTPDFSSSHLDRVGNRGYAISKPDSSNSRTRFR